MSWSCCYLDIGRRRSAVITATIAHVRIECNLQVETLARELVGMDQEYPHSKARLVYFKTCPLGHLTTCASLRVPMLVVTAHSTMNSGVRWPSR